MKYKINTMDKCNKYLDKLKEDSWKLWQMQYYWDLPEGFHAWFWKTGKEDIEIVTYNEDVQKAIIKL